MSLATTVKMHTLINQLWITCGVLLISFIVLAKDDSRLELAPAYSEILSDDIYESAEGWRKPPMFENEWRAPKPKEKSRIKFGYDSVYEEMRSREDARSSNNSFDLRDPKPNTLFRFEF